MATQQGTQATVTLEHTCINCGAVEVKQWTLITPTLVRTSENGDTATSRELIYADSDGAWYRNPMSACVPCNLNTFGKGRAA